MWALFRRRRVPSMWGQHPGEMVPCSGPGKANTRSIRGVSAASHVGPLGLSQAWPEDPRVPLRAPETLFGAVGPRGQSRRPARALSATVEATKARYWSPSHVSGHKRTSRSSDITQLNRGRSSQSSGAQKPEDGARDDATDGDIVRHAPTPHGSILVKRTCERTQADIALKCHNSAQSWPLLKIYRGGQLQPKV